MTTLNERVFDTLMADGHRALADEFAASQPKEITVSTITTTPHLDCARVGKYDCNFDDFVFRTFADEGHAGEGDVQAPCAWFVEFDLDDGAEPGFAEHYGSRFLILREFNDGRATVETYATEEMREERLTTLRTAYDEWDIDAFTDFD